MWKILKISQQISWQLLGKIISSVNTILCLGLITRTYGATGTGIYTLALTYLAYFALAVDFGLNGYLLPKFLEKDPTKIWRQLVGLRLVLSIVLLVIGLVGILVWPTNWQLKQMVLAGLIFSILSPAIFITNSAIFQTKLRFDFWSYAWISQSLAELLIIIVVVNRASLPWLIAGNIGGWVLLSVISLLLVKRFIRNLKPLFDFSFAKETVKSAWPISLTLILNLIYFRADSFMISFLKNFSEVGIYNVAYSVFQSALVVPTFIMNAFYPIMLIDFKKDQTQFKRDLITSVGLMIGVGLLGTIATLILAPLVILVIAGGSGFTGSTTSLQILSFGFPAFFGSAVLMWALITYQKYRIVLYIYLFGLLINVILNWLFIPQYSYLASSWITGISEYLILILQIVVLWRSR